jgi:hypothetical protein
LGRLTQFGNFRELTTTSVFVTYLNKPEKPILAKARDAPFNVKYIGFDISVIFKLSRILF